MPGHPDSPEPIPPCRITVDFSDLCELALRLTGEDLQNEALAEIHRMMIARVDAETDA